VIKGEAAVVMNASKYFREMKTHNLREIDSEIAEIGSAKGIRKNYWEKNANDLFITIK
jgi:hypothetical protein